MLDIIPSPKFITDLKENNYFTARGIVCTDAIFDSAVSVFLMYLKKSYHVELCGEANLTISLDKSLPSGAYRIRIEETLATMFAADEIGMNYAFATLFQMVQFGEKGVLLPIVKIYDYPDSSWRGLMVDVARQFHPVSYLYDYIDACWLYKMNRFQIHFSDDQSYTLPSKAFPKLSTPNATYSEEDLSALCQYAKDRRITIVPEVDCPGHATPFNKTYPEIFGNLEGILSADERVFDALDKIYDEICELFPDSPYIHLGGDEAEIFRWKGSPESQEWKKSNNLKDEDEMYCEYIRRITDMVIQKERTPVVWEGFPKEGNYRIDKRVIVFSWENLYQTAPELLEGGFKVINASWQPLYVVSPKKYWSPKEILDWDIFTWKNWWEKSKAYPNGITVPETDNVIGGQMCVWGDCLAGLGELIGCEWVTIGLKTELKIVLERLSALSEKTWNINSIISFSDFEKARKQSNVLLKGITRELEC